MDSRFLNRLSNCDLRRLLWAIDKGPGAALYPHQTAWVNEHAVNLLRPERPLGSTTKLDKVLIPAAVQEKLDAHSEACALKAQYIRDYMYDVLELCPTDHFALAPDGGWMVDPAGFNSLPFRVKRLIEGVELRMVGGRAYLSVKFISKTTILALAARYTMTQKVEATITTVPWDRIAGIPKMDPLQRKLETLQVVAGSNGTPP